MIVRTTPTSPRHRSGVAACLVATMLAAVLAGCGSDAQEGGLDAAEPAEAPEPTQQPAGTFVEVGPAPQGVVYAVPEDALAVAVRDPERLLILDPTTLETRRTVPLQGKVRHLQATRDGTVLVPSESADILYQVDPSEGLVENTQVGNYPHDAAGAPNGDVVVAEEFAGSASVVRDDAVVHTFDDLTQPGGVTVVGSTALLVDVEDFTLTSYDLDELERIDRVSAGEGPTHVVAAGDDRVAVTDTRGNRVLLFSIDPLRKVDELELPGSPYGIASDPRSDTVWVTLTGTNEVVGLDVSGDTPREVARYATVRQPDTVAVSPGAETVWVTGTSDGVVQRITRGGE